MNKQDRDPVREAQLDALLDEAVAAERQRPQPNTERFLAELKARAEHRTPAPPRGRPVVSMRLMVGVAAVFLVALTLVFTVNTGTPASADDELAAMLAEVVNLDPNTESIEGLLESLDVEDLGELLDTPLLQSVGENS